MSGGGGGRAEEDAYDITIEDTVQDTLATETEETEEVSYSYFSPARVAGGILIPEITEQRVFEVTEEPGRPTYYCLVMFAYPSGHAHVGHVWALLDP